MDRHCERIVWQIVPAIRREMALVLVERGFKRREIAKMLGISEAALTQYLKGRRGTYELPEWAKERVREYARNTDCIDLCEICWELRKDPRFAEMLGGGSRECKG